MAYSTDDDLLMGYEISDLDISCNLAALNAYEAGRGRDSRRRHFRTTPVVSGRKRRASLFYILENGRFIYDHVKT